MDIFSFFSLIGGLVFFLYGMDLMGDSLKKLAGGKLESILARLTSTKWKGFLLGLIVTAVIQSSAATTVMLVGFVNSGIMRLGQTIGIIMGANLGTTVTAWLLSTANISGTATLIQFLKPQSFTPILAAVGLIMTMVTRNDSKKNLGLILIGFAILMFGMDTMSSSVEGLRDNETFVGTFTMFSNPIMGILIGFILTAIIQSSSASVGILQALSLSCVIPYSVAIPIILGENIGATVTPMISAVTGNSESKRVALACLYIKIIGVVIIAGIFYALNRVIGFGFMSQQVNAVNIAVVHSLFNILSTVILLPFSSLIEKLTVLTIRGKDEEQETDMFATLDERFLEMPSFAVEKCRELVGEMANIACRSLDNATELLDDFNAEAFSTVKRLEARIDKYEDKISAYLVKITAKNMSAKDSKVVTELLHCVGDIERISDHALNIAEAAEEIHNKQIAFSQQAQNDLRIITSAVAEILDLAILSLTKEDMEAAKRVEPLEQVIDRLKRKIKNGHISRLRQGDCTMELGFILSDLLTNYERISDHCSNIAVCIIEIANGSFEAHEYLSQLKSGEEEFEEMYQTYKQKYYMA